METYNDVFHEQIIKKKKTSKDSSLKFGLVLLAILIVMATFSIPALRKLSMIATFIAMAVIWGAYYLSKGFNLEFEYSITNNYFDIAKIMDKSRRKEMYSIDCKAVTKMSKLELRDGHDIGPKADKVVDVTSGEDNKGKVYYIIFKDGDKTIKLYFEPNDDILAACKKAVPRVAQMSVQFRLMHD